jgi:hypothetical protein
MFFLGSVCSVLFAQSRVITLEGDVINGTVTSISNNGMVRVGDKELPLDGLRSIVPLGNFNQNDESQGRVVLICGTEFAVTKISLFEEIFTLSVQDLGDIKVPIDSVRALRFGRIRRGSRFQKGLLNWKETKELDTFFISGGAELQEVEGLIEELNQDSMVFDREDKLQSIAVNRTYGVVLASPLLKDGDRPSCLLSLKGGSRIRADINELNGDEVRLSMIEDIELNIPWGHVKRVSLRSPRLVFVSDIEPVYSKVNPIVAFQREFQRDRTVTGLPIQINDQVYDKGLGFASGMQIKFLNEGPYDLFIAEIGIDDDSGGLGDCEFVVKSDEGELFRGRMRGGEPAKLIKVDITGCDSITLEVDPGVDLDIADHADWADACFLQRSK